MEKKPYYIEVIGETCGYDVRDLTNEQYELIKSIFEECSSEYIDCRIFELPDIDKLYIDWNISEKFKNIQDKFKNELRTLSIEKDLNKFDYTIRGYIADRLIEKFNCENS